MKCEFCGKEYSSKIGFSNHVRRCPSNPNRKLEQLTDAGKAKMSMSAKRQKQVQWTDEFRKKHSESMKRAVRDNPDSYSSSNRGRTKQQVIDGIRFQGQWEVDFYLWAKNANLSPIRPMNGFRYEWNGSRLYFPDFYISSLDLYVEVKGYETDRDRAKWRDFPYALRIIKEHDIKQIRLGHFVGL